MHNSPAKPASASEVATPFRPKPRAHVLFLARSLPLYTNAARCVRGKDCESTFLSAESFYLCCIEKYNKWKTTIQRRCGHCEREIQNKIGGTFGEEKRNSQDVFQASSTMSFRIAQGIEMSYDADLIKDSGTASTTHRTHLSAVSVHQPAHLHTLTCQNAKSFKITTPTGKDCPRHGRKATTVVKQ